MAALVVCAGHARSQILLPLADVGDPGSAVRVFYAATSIGNGAVMVFFVLSGYFVGGSVLSQRSRGHFAWQEYLVARLTRLWVVLLPALLLTFLLDSIGLHLLGDSAKYVPGGLVEQRGGVGVLLGNAFFLQAGLVPVYGTNSPLWSLGYEFVYYILFPLIACGVFGRRVSLANRALCVLVAVIIIGLTGLSVILLSLPWVLGAAVAWQRLRIVAILQARRRSLLRAARVLLVALLVISVAVDKVQGGDRYHLTGGGVLTALFGAALVATCLVLTPPAKGHPSMGRIVLARVSRLAGFSYSLYAIHEPILSLVAASLSPSGSTSSTAATPAGILLWMAVIVLLVVCGWLFGLATERHYPFLKRGVLALMWRRARPTRTWSA